jgi:hypothetical protein
MIRGIAVLNSRENELILMGRGFAAGSPVEVLIDGILQAGVQPKVTPAGDFQISLKLGLQVGAHQVSVRQRLQGQPHISDSSTFLVQHEDGDKAERRKR